MTRKRWLLGLTTLMGLPCVAAAGQEPYFRMESLADGPFATMHTLFEKTIFKVDILTLDLRFNEDVQRRLKALASGRALTPTLADSVAAVAVDARDIWARLRFERGVSLDQFVDAVRGNAGRARDAGIISDDTFDDVARNLPVWYAFLEDRRIHDGDEMFYRIRGDTLRTVYRAVTGEILLDQVDVGAQRRLAVMGGYFAPKSDFRKGLIESLFDR